MCPLSKDIQHPPRKEHPVKTIRRITILAAYTTAVAATASILTLLVRDLRWLWPPALDSVIGLDHRPTA
ncbi:hypothetical protein CRH09_30335 [Nocardia terpenica]|uniref:Uncharacterized protein n=1 Tax=Nocardia terpenica TaxID=455432 RepID=A0A291RRE7_9NOCA|nr:hypothetical protein CRH09_30335 [Nocardia terpenica]